MVNMIENILAKIEFTFSSVSQIFLNPFVRAQADLDAAQMQVIAEMDVKDIVESL